MWQPTNIRIFTNYIINKTQINNGSEFVYLCGVKKIVAIVFAFAALCAGAAAQTIKAPKGYPMYYEVHDGDTTFFDTIDPIWVFPRGRGFKKSGDWRREYRLVYNFNKIYPYALVGRKLMAQVDSTIAADATKRSQRTQYINQVEKELLSLFTADIKNMTTSQGLLLMRLVDRECGMSAYTIIKEYESGFAANFWQIVAKLFSQDLKTRYIIQYSGRPRSRPSSMSTTSRAKSKRKAPRSAKLHPHNRINQVLLFGGH